MNITDADLALQRAMFPARAPRSCKSCRNSRPTAHGSIYCTLARAPMRRPEETHEQLAARCKFYQEEL